MDAIANAGRHRGRIPSWALVAFMAYLAWNVIWLLLGRIPPSLLTYATGYPCPTTGCVRSLHSLVHGRFLEGLMWNTMCVPYVVLLISSSVILARSWAKGRTLRLPNLVGAIWLAALAVGWISKFALGSAYW